MKEPSINGQRAVVAHHQAAEVAEPGEGAFHGPWSPVAPQGPTVLRRRLATILAMRTINWMPRRASCFRNGSLS